MCPSLLVRLLAGTTLPAILPALLAAVASAAQEPEPLLVEGDVIQGVGAVTRIDGVRVQSSGVWLVLADTDHANAAADEVLVRSGVLHMREGDALDEPVGATIGEFETSSIDRAGDGCFAFVLDGTGGTSDDSGVYFETSRLIQEGDLVDSSEVSLGTYYSGFFEAKHSDGGYLLLSGAMEDAGISGALDRVLALFDVHGGDLHSTDVLWKEGDFLPGQAFPITIFGNGPHQSAVNAGGHVLFFADTSGPGDNDSVVFLDDVLVAKEGEPSPVPGRDWSFSFVPVMDLDDAGRWALRAQIVGATDSDELIASNGAAFVQEGDVLPDIAPFHLTSLGHPATPIRLGRHDELAWYGEWSDPDTTRDSGLFLNHRLLVREGDAAAGSSIAAFADEQDAFALSRDGRYLVFEASLADGRDGAFLVRPSLGESYGSAVANSTGAISQISAKGSVTVARDDFVLYADGVPPRIGAPPAGQNGFFFHGSAAIDVPFGNGRRLVGGVIHRSPPTVAEYGLLVRELALPALPHVVAGSTWHFQALYRDPAAGGARFNTSDGLRVLFE